MPHECDIGCNMNRYLHSNNTVDEKQDHNEQADIGQSFHGLNERPEKYPHGISLPKEFD